jgi:hypothetical protein
MIYATLEVKVRSWDIESLYATIGLIKDASTLKSTESTVESVEVLRREEVK